MAKKEQRCFLSFGFGVEKEKKSHEEKKGRGRRDGGERGARVKERGREGHKPAKAASKHATKRTLIIFFFSSSLRANG